MFSFFVLQKTINCSKKLDFFLFMQIILVDDHQLFGQSLSSLLMQMKEVTSINVFQRGNEVLSYLEKNSVAMPFTTSLVLGKRKEKLEIGAGYTLATKNFLEREVFPTAALGFRVIDNNGTLLRIVYTPHYRDDKVINWFGVSLGRNF